MSRYLRELTHGGRFVATGLMSAAVQDHVSSKGVEFADAADAAGAMLKIASDPSINGKSARFSPQIHQPVLTNDCAHSFSQVDASPLFLGTRRPQRIL